MDFLENSMSTSIKDYPWMKDTPFPYGHPYQIIGKFHHSYWQRKPKRKIPSVFSRF